MPAITLPAYQCRWTDGAMPTVVATYTAMFLMWTVCVRTNGSFWYF